MSIYTFHRVSRFHDEALQEIFTHQVFSLLLRKKLIGLPLVETIRKVYEVDPLCCPPCGGRMRIICHLELTFEAERPPPSHHVQQELLKAAEESGEREEFN